MKLLQPFNAKIGEMFILNVFYYRYLNVYGVGTTPTTIFEYRGHPPTVQPTVVFFLRLSCSLCVIMPYRKEVSIHLIALNEI